MDHINALQRCARRHGWKQEAHNSLDYFTIRFCRPEPEGRVSRVMVRVTNKIVDAQIEIGGLRQSFTLPTLQRIESVLASTPPRPVLYTDDGRDDMATTMLEQAVKLWRAKPPADLADATRCGDLLATAADEVVRKIRADEEIVE